MQPDENTQSVDNNQPLEIMPITVSIVPHPRDIVETIVKELGIETLATAGHAAS